MGKSKTEWGSSQTEGMQNGVGSEEKGGEIQERSRGKEKKKKRKKKEKETKKKRRGDSLHSGLSGPSHLKGDFLKF